jgi:hypothetical protein
MSLTVRLRGLALSVLGLGLSYVLIATQMALRWEVIFVDTALLGVGMAGLVELISGYPFYKIAKKWDPLPPLINTLLGFLIIGASIPLIIVIVKAFTEPWP